MTSHRVPRYQSEIYPQGLYITKEGIEESDSRPVMSSPAVRPVSWHPSSMAGIQQRPESMYDTPFRHSLAYQTVAVNGMPTPMTQPDSSTEIPADAWFNLDNSMNIYQSSNAYNRYDQTGLRLHTSFHNDHSLESDPQYSLSSFPTSDEFPSFNADYSTQAWTESLSEFPTYTAPPTPDFLPIQNPASNWQNNIADVPVLPRKESKELIGMGLYDHPDRTSLSSGSLTDSHMSLLMSERHNSVGKGLKLEETWEPPEEDEEDDDEDSSSEDDAGEETERESQEETIMEIEKPSAIVVTNEIQTATADQGQVNMSDQSFFFDHDVYGNGTVVERPMHTAPLLRGSSWNSYRW